MKFSLILILILFPHISHSNDNCDEYNLINNFITRINVSNDTQLINNLSLYLENYFNNKPDVYSYLSIIRFSRITKRNDLNPVYSSLNYINAQKLNEGLIENAFSIHNNKKKTYAAIKKIVNNNNSCMGASSNIDTAILLSSVTNYTEAINFLNKINNLNADQLIVVIKYLLLADIAFKMKNNPLDYYNIALFKTKNLKLIKREPKYFLTSTIKYKIGLWLSNNNKPLEAVKFFDMALKDNAYNKLATLHLLKHHDKMNNIYLANKYRKHYDYLSTLP